MLNSPLAAATRMRVYRQRTRQRPPERGLRMLAMLGSLLVHLIFLFAFVLGPAYPLQPPAPARQQILQVRLIEPPEPPPPPPVRGTPPKERGPVHQGSSRRAAAVSERSANIETPVAATPTLAVVTPPPPQAALPAPKPVRLTPSRVPRPVPPAKPQAVPPPASPVPVQPRPVPVPPLAPPKLQPETLRKPQTEGNQPMPPPISLVMPKLALPSPPIDVPRMAPPIEMPANSAPLSVTPAPVTPPVPTPPPTPPSPEMNLQADLMAPVPLTVPALPQPESAAAPLARVVLEVAAPSVEPAPVSAPPAPPSAEPAEKIQAIAAVALPSAQALVKPALMRPLVSAPTTVAELAPAAPQPAAAAPGAAQAMPATTPAGAASADVSRAPDAIAQGSDTARPGQLNGVAAVPSSAATSASAAAVPPANGQGRAPGQGEHSPGAGQPAGNQPGADHGAPHGALGDYVQLRPQGDTKIMNHGVPNIGYQATRFEKDWTPENESSVDTALRRAVEKTTVKHTFHLPQGIRVECAVMPLLPMSLLGCHNPDPPAQPVADKVYDRLHLAPANPVATPVPNPASTAASAPATVRFDNSAECAAARVAGGPPPPGCAPIELPARPLRAPASSSTSWAPASDQFH